MDYSNNGAGKHGTKKLALLQSYDPSSLELDLSDDEEFGYTSDEDAVHSFVAMLHAANTDDMDEAPPPFMDSSSDDDDTEMPALMALRRPLPAPQRPSTVDEDDIKMPALADSDSDDETSLLSDQ